MICRVGSIPTGGRDSGGGGYGASRPSGPFRPRVTLTIRWYSVLPIKQTVVKTHFGNFTARYPQPPSEQGSGFLTLY